MQTVLFRQSPSGPIVEVEVPELAKVTKAIDIPALNAGQTAQVEVTGADVTAAGFLASGGLSANPPDGLSNAIIQGECFVQDADTLKIKFHNSSANPVGPFNGTTFIFTQVR